MTPETALNPDMRRSVKIGLARSVGSSRSPATVALSPRSAVGSDVREQRRQPAGVGLRVTDVTRARLDVLDRHVDAEDSLSWSMSSSRVVRVPYARLTGPARHAGPPPRR
jgi:hypothetical protein